MLTKILRAAPHIAEESATGAAKLTEIAKSVTTAPSMRMLDEALQGLSTVSKPKSNGTLRQSPFFHQADEFADQLYSTMKTGTARDKPGILLEIEKSLNVLRNKSFPYVPEVIVKSTDASAHGSAFRNRINVNLDLERFEGDLRVSKSGNALRDSALANAASHEFVHVEQSALRWWRKADQMEIGARPLPRQIRSLLQTESDDLRLHKKDDPNFAGVLTESAFVEHVLKYRDGRSLTSRQATRADSLTQSFATSKAHWQFFQKLYEDNQKAQAIMRGQTPATDADFAAFFDRVTSNPVPSKMASLVLEKGLLSPLPKEESGKVLFQAFKRYADSAYTQYLNQGYKPYRNTHHEREAHSFGDAVAAHFDLRKALGAL